MPRRRYESRLFFLILLGIPILGFVVSILDPTGVYGGRGNVLGGGSVYSITPVLLWLGVAMLLLGTVIRVVAVATLRRNFSNRLRIRQGHTLVRTGIYRWIRHPAYLGLILIFLAIPVLLSSVLGFLVMLSIVPLLLHRIRLEEKMLVEHFGAEYEEYRKSSKRLIPFLY
jgi:protein-S-isoprenylcysteine O-methyltransferase Ste14